MSRAETSYHKLALGQMRRILSRMDREKSSITYGSFDRTYWAWKFTDFPGSRFQEALYALTRMYIGNFPGNEYRDKPLVLEWIIAGFCNWRGLQHPDGSFDEAYPCEHSLAATAFTSFYLGEAMLLLDTGLMDEQEHTANITTFKRAGDWLCRNDEHHGVLSNHLAAAAAALVVIYRLTGNEKYSKRAQFFIDRILEHQSPEGWYEEYGGADFGYQTHGTFYLARVWYLTHDEKLLASLKRSVTFLSHFFHPNQTLGGEYGSRNTTFYFPAGMEILSSACQEAAAIAKFMRSSVTTQKAAGLAMMDAYNLSPLMNNYLFAHDAAQNITDAPSLPFAGTGHWEFPDAGLVVHVTDAYQAIFAASKGGVLKIYDKHRKQLSYSDCGYWLELNNGNRASSQSFSRKNTVKMESDRVFVRTQFARMNQKVMSPWLFMAFRIFMLTVGRFHRAALAAKSLIVRVLVSRRRTIGLSLERSVAFSSATVMLRDTIVDTSKDRRRIGLKLGSKFSTIHMGSARYFQPDELDPVVIDAVTPFHRTYTWEVK